MTTEPRRRGEFDLIATFLEPLTGGDPRALGLTDDAAVVPQKTGCDTVVSTDTMVAGVHFLMTETPDIIARRLLRVNLSDIAAMGARPVGYFLNLTLSDSIGNDWLEKFASGLAADQALFGVTLLGGDTTRTPGQMTLTVTLFGEVASGSAVRRNTARPGDLVFVLPARWPMCPPVSSPISVISAKRPDVPPRSVPMRSRYRRVQGARWRKTASK